MEGIYLRRHFVRTSLGGRNYYLVQINQNSEMLLMINKKAYKNKYKYILFSIFIGRSSIFMGYPICHACFILVNHMPFVLVGL